MDHDTLKAVADQMMNDATVVVGKQKYKVKRTGSGRLRSLQFEMSGKEYRAIEQNPEKPSRWGKLAREGHQVVQVLDISSGKYVAAVVDGKVTEYTRKVK